jgi:CRISPR type I-E-associated protein CasB/Cse2
MTTPEARPAESPPEASTPEARFANHLHWLAQSATAGEGASRARLARLRTAVGRRGVAPLAYREIGDALTGVPSDERDAYLTVASLFAVHAAKSDRPWLIARGASLGASCRQARRDGSVSMDLRFAALLDARREDLPYRLRQVVALLAAHDVGVRYDVLLGDILRWTEPGREVQRRWAESYWAPAVRPTTS